MTNDPSAGNEPINPYAPTAFGAHDAAFSELGGASELAGRFKRLAAVMIDGCLMMFILVPIQVGTDFTGRIMLGQATALEQLAMTLVGMLVYLLLNGYLLVTRGQSIGKLAVGIRIVDAKTNELLSFTRVYLIRLLWTLPLTVIGLLIPGNIDEQVFSLVYLADALFIFRSNRRCIHDLLAGSKVVKIIRN